MTWLKKCFTWHWTTHDMAEKMVLLGIGQLMTWLKKCFTWHWTTHDMAEKMFHLTLDNS
jgi:hypothetical protein